MKKNSIGFLLLHEKNLTVKISSFFLFKIYVKVLNKATDVKNL